MITIDKLFPKTTSIPSDKQLQRVNAVNQLAAIYLENGEAGTLDEAEQLAIVRLKRIWGCFDGDSK